MPSDPTEIQELQDQLAQARREIVHLKGRLEELRDQDPATGLPNRLRLGDRAAQALLMAHRQGTQVAALFVELDRFKTVSHSLGFAEVDELIAQVARRLGLSLRPGDTLARVGTDQFAVLLPEVRDGLEPLKIAQALLDSLGIPYRVAQRETRLTASIGISIYPQDGDSASALVKEAENACARARQAGGNGIQCTTTTLSEAAFERQQMDASLSEALPRNQLRVLYQPQQSMDGTITGMEALLRWDHPTLGTVSPTKFIPMAEENLLIHNLGQWTLASACRQAAAWQARTGRPLRIAVNVSPVQVAHPRLVETVVNVLHETRLRPETLELEITESSLLRISGDSGHSPLQELKALGVRIGLDDFGTGYSSLSYLQHLPIDTLKIDQAFVRTLFPATPGALSSLPIVKTIIELGRNLGLTLVAEGVETQAQREALANLGCDAFQGYLMGQPLEAADLEARLQAAPRTGFSALLGPGLLGDRG